ncbi:MAG: winged helix-turn-helix domain-containing protein [Acidimicrobiales bacterium]|jgi:hypothetical protein
MSPTIRVDDEVYEELKANAEPFVDTPNTVLRRLLSLDPATEPHLDDSDAPEEAVLLAVPSVRSAVTPRRSARAKRVGVKKVARKKPAKPRTAKRTRAPAGALLPEERYELPMLQALVELGGSASSRAVIERVGTLLKDQFTDLDKEKLESGGVRWESRVQFVRLRLIRQGLMTKEAGRGVWAISSAGQRRYEQRGSGVA